MPKRKYVIDELGKVQQRITDFFNTTVLKRNQEQEAHNKLLGIVYEAKQKGLTLDEIASLVGQDVNRQNIFRWLKEYNRRHPNA
jgi:hypothetical protein